MHAVKNVTAAQTQGLSCYQSESVFANQTACVSKTGLTVKIGVDRLPIDIHSKQHILPVEEKYFNNKMQITGFELCLASENQALEVNISLFTETVK